MSARDRDRERWMSRMRQRMRGVPAFGSPEHRKRVSTASMERAGSTAEVCPHGHARSEHGFTKPSGHIGCRACSRAATKRSREKRLPERPCACGCGQLTRGQWVVGHHPKAALSGERNPMYGRAGPASPRWRGGRRTRPDGYVLVKIPPDHPFAAMGSRRGRAVFLTVFEHRLVMAEHLGRALLPTEVVHHRNGDPSDNRPENLRLFQSQAEHRRHHVQKPSE